MKRSLRSWLWRVPLDEEVDEEIAFHIEMRTRELIARGIDPKTAREMAASRLGDVTRLKRTCVDLGRKRDREMRFTQWLEERRGDVTFAIRQMKASPAFTFVAVVTLALGIGANSAMFALADAILLRPLPFPHPEQLVMLSEQGGLAIPTGRVSPANFYDWRDRNRTFQSMAGYNPSASGSGATMIGRDGIPEVVPARMVTAGFFDVLGVKPIAGRTFLSSDETATPTAVVISEQFWRTRFNADPAVIGREVRGLGTVIGVAPASFQFLTPPSSHWRLLPYVPQSPTMRRLPFMAVIGRLKPGVTRETALADLTSVAKALATEHPDTNKSMGIRFGSMREGLFGRELRLTSILFLGVVGFVLLMCCANVANLLLARAAVRARELAVRSALGAGRPRIVAQLLTESLVLAAVGGVLGAAVGAAILQIAPSVVPADLMPSTVTIGFDGRVVAFCATAALIVGVLFGLAPAWHATGTSLIQVVTSSDGRTATGRGGRLRGLLVIGEVATAVLLLCGAGLLLRTLLVVQDFDLGYRADRVLTMDITVVGYENETLTQFYQRVEREVVSVPGVRSAGWASTLPVGDSQVGALPFEIVGEPAGDPNRRPMADYQMVSPAYFRTVDLPMGAGRAFTESDTRQSPQVAIVNEAFVRRYLQGKNPIGVRIAIAPRSFVVQMKPIEREIIGVARQVKGHPDETEDLVQVYVPQAQSPWNEAYLVVRAAGGSTASLAREVRKAIARVDDKNAVRNVLTLDEITRNATARHRFRAVMVVTFAGLALFLAMAGVFGVLAYSVQQRLREFGVRIALGATTTNVLTLVLATAGRMIAIGVVIGLTAAAALGQSISTFLFGVRPMDPATFGSVAIVLAVTAAIATAAPAIRATRVDPVVAFRNE